MNELVKEFLNKGILLSPNVINEIKKDDIDEIISKIGSNDVVLTKELYNFFKRGPTVNVIFEYKKNKRLRKITDFLEFYNNRLNFLRDVLKEKMKLKDITSINKLGYGTKAALIGMIRDVEDNGFRIEDTTGSIFCLSKEKVLEDEVIGVKGEVVKNGFLVEKIYYPDIPLDRGVKLADEDCYALFVEKLDEKPSRLPSYIFTFTIRRDLLKLKTEIITTNGNAPYPNVYSLNEPFMVDIKGIRVFVLKMNWIDELKNKLGLNDSKSIIIQLLRKRHFLPYKFVDGDPYLLRDIPDIIVISGLNEQFFFNYKGVSVISLSGKNGYLVNLKNREYETENHHS
ncbi:MAG: hypothetical protein J7K87_01775 [Candidatus Aenigmarchaeota archaeon]|nr:hypothetical protein [Candidatus Aenigmarchaeota archaeon]